jgi:hypothetical protein
MAAFLAERFAERFARSLAARYNGWRWPESLTSNGKSLTDRSTCRGAFLRSANFTMRGSDQHNDRSN